jgi:hypothetical protein
MFSFFNLFKNKSKESKVSGTLQYIPGTLTSSQDTPVTLEEGELVKRMYVQPALKQKIDHSSIIIYTGNPFRDVRRIKSLDQL